MLLVGGYVPSPLSFPNLSRLPPHNARDTLPQEGVNSCACILGHP